MEMSQTIEGYLNPSVARLLPAGSRERELASCALRNLWHAIFDACPGLIDLAPPDGKKILDRFLIWADEKYLSMTWSLHMHLLNWLATESEHAAQLSDELKQELVVASAVRWASNNMSDVANLHNMGILISSKMLDGYIVGARKTKTADGRLQLKLLRGDVSAGAEHDVYALVQMSDGWEHGEWMMIPN
jgi:hypothetical protein